MTRPVVAKLAGVLIPALFLRLVFSGLFFHPDIKKYYYQVQFLGQGVINVYEYISIHKNTLPNSDTFNYPPGNYYLLGIWGIAARLILGHGFSSWINDWGPLVYSSSRMFEFMLFLKLPYLLADFLILLILLKYHLRESSSPDRLVYLWLFNPVSLYAVYMLGQIDIIPALLTVAALFCVKKQKPALSALLLGLGAAVKTYPLLLIPFVLIRARSARQFISAVVLAAAGFLLPILPVLGSSAFRSTMTDSTLTRFIFYAGIPVSGSQTIPLFVLIWGLTFWLSWRDRSRSDLVPEFLTVTLSVILIAYFHAQWAVWSLPFLVYILARDIRLWPVFAAMSVGYFGTVFLLPDQFTFFGLFSAINPRALLIPPVPEIISGMIDPGFLQSLFHTLLAASGFFIIYSVWRKYERP